MATQSDQDKRRYPRFRRYGELDSDTCNRNGKKDCLDLRINLFRPINAGIHAMSIQKRIIHKGELLVGFGESRGGRYIRVQTIGEGLLRLDISPSSEA